MINSMSFPNRNIYNGIIFPSLNPAKTFSVLFPMNSQQKVRQLGRITFAVIKTSNEFKCPLLWEIWMYNFSRRILEMVFVGSIVNIRNECLFFWVHGEWIVARNKQMVRVHAIYLSRATIHSPWTQKKRHSFLNKITHLPNYVN